MHLAFNVAAMLIAFMSLVALVNGILGFLHRGVTSLAFPESFAFLISCFPENLQQILGVVFRPIAWTMGVSWKDSFAVGNLLGTRLVLNELVSFLQLGQMGSSLDQRSFIITTALCGFAMAHAIQVGGIGASFRRHDLAALGIRAMIASFIATPFRNHRGHGSLEREREIRGFWLERNLNLIYNEVNRVVCGSALLAPDLD
jgi:CNT family concentrative nucleoside transporter